MKRISGIVTAVLLACMILPAWGDDHGSRWQARMQALEHSEISMLQAIINIESASGARVVIVEVDPFLKPPTLRKGPMVYGLLTLKGCTFTVYFVDIASGKVLEKYTDWFSFWRLRSLAKSDLLAQAKISLVQAIALAESQTGCRTLQVKTKLDGESLYYRITMLVKDKPKRVNIDASSGKLCEIATD